jgi:hypothetical protein
MEALSDSAARALCGLAATALEEKGVDPILAAAFAERACRPLVGRAIRATPGAVRTAAGKVKRGASAYNKKYAKAYKALKKKHPRTPFATLAKKAHAKAKRMK